MDFNRLDWQKASKGVDILGDLDLEQLQATEYLLPKTGIQKESDFVTPEGKIKPLGLLRLLTKRKEDRTLPSSYWGI